MPRLLTIGHGARTIQEFLATAGAGGVEIVVDVRRFPGSRRHPHFARYEMHRWLPENGIAYEFHGDVFGGRRKPLVDSRHSAWRNDAFRGYADHTDSPAFRSALEALLGRPRAIAVMCAETLWWRCHRRLIADAAVVRGAEVVHLMSPDSQQPHPLNEALRVDDDGWPVYDVGVDRPLPLDG